MHVGISDGPEFAADAADRTREAPCALGWEGAVERRHRGSQAADVHAHVVNGARIVAAENARGEGEDGFRERPDHDSGRALERKIRGKSLVTRRFGQSISLFRRATYAEVRYLARANKGLRMVAAGPGAKKILVVDDESAILQTLRFNLERNGYSVATAGDGRTAIALAASERPDLIIMDIMLPVLDGIEACKEIRKSSGVPIIMLTARDQEIDKVLALELGADDYVTKPFSLHEFLARVKARLRRQNGNDVASRSEAIAVGEIVLDPSRQSLVVRGRHVALAPKEFNLLHVLMENRGRVVTRQTLLDKVWGYDFEGEHQTISVHVRWLREKIELDPNNPSHIITVRSRGYMFKE